MYKLSYAEIMEGDPREARAREQVAIDHGIALMQRAEAEGGRSPQRRCAMSRSSGSSSSRT
jgi:flagellar biosynthesis regulator FlaF